MDFVAASGLGNGIGSEVDLTQWFSPGMLR